VCKNTNRFLHGPVRSVAVDPAGRWPAASGGGSTVLYPVSDPRKSITDMEAAAKASWDEGLQH